MTTHKYPSKKILLGIGALLLLAIIIFLFIFFTKKKHKEHPLAESVIPFVEAQYERCFTFEYQMGKNKMKENVKLSFNGNNVSGEKTVLKDGEKDESLTGNLVGTYTNPDIVLEYTYLVNTFPFKRQEHYVLREGENKLVKQEYILEQDTNTGVLVPQNKEVIGSADYPLVDC
jgi:flagellar basal body-associated protein FliL